MALKTVAEVIRILEPLYGLKWVVGKEKSKLSAITDISWGSHPKVVGHFNPIHPNQVQVLGAIEIDYLDTLDHESLEEALKSLFSDVTIAVIIADNLDVPDEVARYARKSGIALLKTKEASNKLVTNLRYRLTGLLSEKITLHGVFMEVISVGVLLSGKSSIGKSELALELITRGHRLIADDAPEFARIAPDIISGQSPEILQDLLEVRGLGILNIRHMYGDSAIKHSKYLRFIINLVEASRNQEYETNRLNSYSRVKNIMGVDIAEITLPVAPGRNLAVMVEAAVRNHLVSLRGYDANEEIIRRHQLLMKDD